MQMITKVSLNSATKPNILALSIACPTKEITCSRNVKELLNPHSSYAVIPSTPTRFIYNTDQILLGALPHTKNLLLDLTLPFYYRGSQGFEEGFYFGRYLIFDQRLIGIKLRCSTKTPLTKELQTFKKWPFRKTSNHKISRPILEFYKSNNFPQSSYAKEIKIGDFVLTFRNIRISLIFENEIKSIQDLNDSKLIAADILSIVSDVPREKMFQSKLHSKNYQIITPLQNQLKQYAKSSKKIVMYTGCKSAPLTQLYLANPFILHHQLPEIRMDPLFLNKGGAITVLCSIQYNQKEKLADKPATIKQVPNLIVNGYLREIKQSVPGKSQKSYPQNWGFNGTIPEEMQEVLKKLQMWYIFSSINECEPFIIPLPLQDMTEMILKQFKQISKFVGKPLKSFIAFYKTEKECIVGEDQQSAEIEIHQSLKELIASSKCQKYFIYTNKSSQLNQLAKLAQSNSKIFICQKQIFMEQQMKRNQQVENIQKRMADFAKKIVDMGFHSLKRIYKENRASPQPLSKDQLVVSISDNLKTIIRSSYRVYPFYKLILELNRKQIEETFGNIELQVINEQRANHSGDLDRSRVLSSSFSMNESFGDKNSKYKEFNQTMESLKKIYGDERKIIQAQCHRCMKYLPKQIMRQCELCHTKTCFLCFQTIKRQKATPQSVRQCVTCKKLCFCGVCTKKKKKQQKQRQKIQGSSIQIQNLSIIHSDKTLEQLEQLRMKKQYQVNACQICEIEGRQMLYIRIVCTQCDIAKCFGCLKAYYKGDRRFINNWLCEKCCPPEPKKPQIQQMIDQQIERGRMQIQRSLSPIPEQPQMQKQISKKTSQKNRRSPSNSASPVRQKNNNNRQNNQQQRSDKRRVKSPSNSNSPPRNKKTLRSPSKSQSPPKRQNNNNSQENSKKRLRSPSHSQSPPLKKQPQKKTKLKSPSKSESPKKQKPQMKKKLRSPSHSESPAKKKQNTQQKPSNQAFQGNNKKKLRSPSHSTSPQREKKQKPRSPSHSASPKPKRQNNQIIDNNNLNQPRKKLRSPSNSGSNASKQNKKKSKSRSRSGSRSRSRSLHRNNKTRDNDQKSESNVLWGKKPDQNNFGSNREFRNNYQDNNNRGRPNNSNWQDRSFQNRDGGRGRGGFSNRGGYRGRNDQNNFNRDGDRWNNNERRQYQNKSFNNSQRSFTQQPQKNQNEQMEAKILNIEQRPNQDIDY